MTKDDIIRMAREAGIEAEADTLCRNTGWVEPLEHFASLVAAHEREACAKLAEELWEDDVTAFDCAVAIRKRGKA